MSLKIALAGLVLNKVITLEVAEKVDRELGNQIVPTTVMETVDEIKKAISKYTQGKGGKYGRPRKMG